MIEELTGGPRWAFREGLAQQWERSFEVGALTWPTLIGSAPFAAGEVIEPGDAEIPFDTTGFEFGLSGGADRVDVDVERLNAEVVRVRSGAGRRSDPGVGVPSGRLEVPLLCLKTTGDLYTPIHLDGDYQRLVEGGGLRGEPGDARGASGGALQLHRVGGGVDLVGDGFLGGVWDEAAGGGFARELGGCGGGFHVVV